MISDGTALVVADMPRYCIDVFPSDGAVDRIALSIRPSSLTLSGDAIWVPDYIKTGRLARIEQRKVTYFDVDIAHDGSTKIRHRK